MFRRKRDVPEDAGAQRVRRLALARLMVVAPCFGLAVALSILIVLGLVGWLAGSTGLASSLPRVGALFAIILVAGRIVIPRLDRRLTDAARSVTSPDVVLPLLEMTNGLPIGAGISGTTNEALARALGDSDAEWWGGHAAEMRKQTRKLLWLMLNSSPVVRREAPWHTALFDAIARAGRTEFLPQIELLEQRADALKISPDLRDAIDQCSESLRRRARRDREAAVLLRSTAGEEGQLLRPALLASDTDPRQLLRASNSCPAPAATTSETVELTPELPAQATGH